MTRADVMRMSDETYRWLRDVELPRLRRTAAWVGALGSVPLVVVEPVVPVVTVPRVAAWFPVSRPIVTPAQVAYVARQRGTVRRMACGRGHSLVGANLRTRYLPDGRVRRLCVACIRANWTRHNAVAKVARAVARVEQLA